MSLGDLVLWATAIAWAAAGVAIMWWAIGGGGRDE